MKSYFNNEEYIYVKSFLRTNPSEALIRTEEYIKKYPNDYIAGVFYSKVLKVLGSFSEALYVLGNIEERYTSNKSYLMILLSIILYKRKYFIIN